MDDAVAAYKLAQYAESTKKGIATATRSYLDFCAQTRCWPDPRTGISDEDLCRYIAWLARTVKYKTIVNYVTMGVRVYHLDTGMPYDVNQNNPAVRAMLKGVKRVLGDPTNQKMPITIDILNKIAHLLLTQPNPSALALLSAFTMGFFCLLRKGQLVPKNRAEGETDTHVLTRKDVFRSPDGKLWIQLTHTKTIQFKERVLRLPLARIPGSLICPSLALDRYLQVIANSPLNSLFQEIDTRTANWVPLSYGRMMLHLKNAIKAIGLDPALYAGQSFRRGGATFLLSIGTDIPSIKAMGDWSSDAYLRYLEFSLGTREGVRDRVEQHLAPRVPLGPAYF